MFITVLALGLTPLGTFAGVKVAGLDLNLSGDSGTISIHTSGVSNDLPDMRVLGKSIEITLDKSDAFTPIAKKVSGASLSAGNVGGKARIVAVLPYEISSDAVSLGWKNNKIEVVFPRGKVVKAALPEPVAFPKEKEVPKQETPQMAGNKVSKDSLNEDYLNGLMNEGKKEAKPEKKDEVSLKQASAVKTSQVVNPAAIKSQGESFSFAGYAAKFTVFLGLVLALFYGAVQLLKKGVFSRGKLGFLNNSQMIEVLSTTYVSPKRTLMVVRAHKQIFLVANSESGFTFLSEMKDTSGLIKEGEKFVTGSNFDTNLSEASTHEAMAAFKLKEDIMESSPLPAEGGLAKLASAKDDIVKFSDELKKKAKKLRPIESRAN